MFEALRPRTSTTSAPFGNGSRMKYVANLLVAINNVASAEAMVLGMKAGLPPQVIFDLVKAGAGNSRVFELRAPMMVKGRYDDVTMKIDVWDKDMQVIGDYARKIRVQTPLFDATKPIYVKAMKSGLGAQDTAAVCAVLEKMAKVKRAQTLAAYVDALDVLALAFCNLPTQQKDVIRGEGRNNGRAQQRSEIRDGMRIDWDVPITMDDGLVLRADVFRPVKDGKYPVILTYGPYAKGLAFQDGYPSAWQRMADKHPDVTAGSSNLYQNWEVVDPEKWVPHDYVCVRVDSRGAGCSPGFIDHFSPRETKDFHDCIEWAGVQPWSNGKVGLNGISYYGINQWHVASLQPPHLAAMCVWEGAADWYRDMTHHGGILSTFWENWYDMQVKTVQYGAGERGKRSRVHGELVCGPETLSEKSWRRTAADFGDRDPRASARRRLSQGALADLGQGRRCRCSPPPIGAARACIRAAISKASCAPRPSRNGWRRTASSTGRISTPTTAASCSCDSSTISCTARTTAGRSSRSVLLQVRHPGEKFVARAENEWPLARTQWTKFYLDPADHGADADKPARRRASQLRRHGRRRSPSSPPPLAQETEITGPSALKLFVSSSTSDADIFIVLRVFTGDLKEVVFQGAIDPHTPIAQGWLRASHRKLDKKLSKPYRPYHTHDEKQPLKQGPAVELDIEIWPTSIVVPAGYRIALSVRGKDYEYGGASGGKLSNFKNELTGCGPFLHDDPRDRPPGDFRRHDDACISAAARRPMCCCRSFLPKKQASGRK